MSLADWSGLAVAVNVPPGGDLLQPHQVPVEEECSVDVPGEHLAEVGLIPAHPGGGVDLQTAHSEIFSFNTSNQKIK